MPDRRAFANAEFSPFDSATVCVFISNMFMWNRKRPVLPWLAVVAWMLVIFSASSDSASGNRSSRIIGPIARWLYPQITEAGLETVIHYVRKTAHVTEYAILAVLLLWAIRKTPGRHQPSTPTRWSPSHAMLAWILSVLYAASDEWHQTFVPSRAGCWQDVVIDSSGAAAGLLLVWAFTWWSFKRKV